MRARHGASLASAIAACAVAIAACSGGGGGGSGATVIGRVQDQAGTGIDDALVSLEGDTTTTNVAGSFVFSAKKGWAALDVTAEGYRRVTTEIKIASGDNSVEITLVTCTPGVDTPCGTPTPNTPTPTPTPPNVVATFTNGVNANVDGGGGPVFGTWTGSAVLTRPGASPALNLGNNGDAADLAFPECWADAAETNDYDMGAPDHCIFWWEGENQGGIVDAGLNDAVFYVYIPGPKFAVTGTPLTFADGIMAGYYEGDFTVDGFQIADYSLQRAATSGTLTLGAAGLTDGANVSITGQATFYIPNLP